MTAYSLFILIVASKIVRNEPRYRQNRKGFLVSSPNNSNSLDSDIDICHRVDDGIIVAVVLYSCQLIGMAARIWKGDQLGVIQCINWKILR